MLTRHPRITVNKAGSVKYLYINYEGVDASEATVMLQALIDDMVEHRLPFIANFKGLKITPKYLLKANEWVDATKDIVPYGVFIGFNSTQNVIFEAYKKVSSFKHGNFQTLEAAEEAIEMYYSRDNT